MAIPSRTPKTKADAPRRKQIADPAMEALQYFRLIFKSIKKHFMWVEQQTGVNGAQLWALAAIVEKPGLKVTELSKALAIHQTTTSNLIDKLVKQKFVRRDRSSTDQRIVFLFPEPKGISLVKGAPKPIRGVLPDSLSRMPESDLAKLNLLLSSVVRNMKVRDASGKTTPLADI
ncbi:MAG: MarR family transcriptional regulator [Betaproteobacteria bacterium]|nr:MarR family transcriptional regulator [Betaproteobacteria bacterium]